MSNDMQSEHNSVNFVNVNGEMIHPSVVRLLQLPHLEQRTEPWYKARERMTITGSDAACVLQNTIHKSPFKSRNILFKEKTGQRERKGGTNIATQHGVDHEDEALEKYMARTGEKALLFGLIPHPTIEWMGASPDAVTHSGRMVEIKVS